MELRLLAFACLVGAAFAGPFQRDTGSRCSTQCPNDLRHKFNYQPGQKYVYNYKGINYINIAGTTRQQKSEISGIAEIHVQDKCDMILKLKNIRIQQNSQEEETRSLIQKLEEPLSFSFVDGKIEQVCASSEESAVSQNIKKGVLSTLINTMETFQSAEQIKEIDSLGSCNTRYTVHQTRGGWRIHKEKDLKSCNNRQSAVTAFITNPYESPDSMYQSLPIMSEEEVMCDQEIKNEVIQQVKCTERATIKPLKQRDSLIEFQGEIELELKNVEQAQRLTPPAETSKESILYNYEQVKDVQSREREVEQILSELCSKASGVIDSTVSKNFFKLVMAVRSMPYPALEKTYNSFKGGRQCDSKKTLDLLLDSLTMAGSEATIKLMVKLYKEKEITGLKARIWPASLALVPNPTEEALSAVRPLLTSEEKSGPILLGVSAMINRYCVKTNCEQIPAVREIIQSLYLSLGRHCSSDNEEEVLAVLKSFGNMGYLGEAEETIMECAKSTEKSVTLRIAAIDAFRRYQQKRPTEFLEIFRNPQENFEVRIAAFQSIMMNATMQQLETIRDVLDNEQNEQVISYASSLIENLKKTSCPLKQEMKQMLRNIEFKTQDVGYWENSKNIDLSTFSVPLNLGGGIETDIIHAPESKIPRSIKTRFDIDLFGKSLNIFEVGMRAEGLETAVKKLLGMDQLESKKQSWSLLRSSNEPEESKSEASIFLRTMDTEFLDFSVRDLTSVGKMMQFADVINKLSQGENVDFSHSFLFMDSKLYIPSVTGRFYAFAMTGSATVALTASSKFDIVNLMSAPRNGDIEGRLQPSANVELTATVGIHSDTPRPDVRIVTLLHSESDIQAQFRVKDSHIALARVSIPSENVTLLKISTDIVEIDQYQNEKRIVQEMQQKVDHCLTALEKPLGLAVCGKLEVPRPFISRTFPYIKGIGNLELSIKKTDPYMQGYEMTLEIPKRSGPVMNYNLAIDTPGSKVYRRFAANLEVREPAQGQREFQLAMISPFKNVSASGHYNLRESVAQGALELQCSSSQRYSLKATTEIQTSGSQKIYKPSIEFTRPHGEPIKVGGVVAYTKGRKQMLTVDIKSNKPNRKPFALTGTLTRDGTFGLSKSSEWTLSSDISAKTPIIDVQLRTASEKKSQQPQAISSTFELEYQRPRQQKQSIKFSAKAHKNLAKINSVAQLEVTQNPSLNWYLVWNMQGKLRESVKNDLTLKYGRNPERNYINVLQISKHSEDDLSECKVNLKAPQFNIDSELKVAADLRAKQNSRYHVEADLRYKQDKHVKGLFQLQHVSVRPMKMQLKAELEYPGRQMMYQDEIEEVSPNTIEGNSVVQWQQGKQASLKYRYQKLSDRSKLHHEFESTLRLPSGQSPLSTKASLRLNREGLDVQGKINTARRQEYFLEAQLHKTGTSRVSLRVPKVEGNLKVIREDKKKAFDMDLKLNLRQPRHIITSASLDMGARKSIEAAVQWDADRRPEQKISISSLLQITPRGSRKSYTSVSKLQLLDITNIDLSGSGELSLLGQHEITLAMSGKNIEPIGVSARQEISKDQLKTSLSYSKSRSVKLQAQLEGKLQKRENEIDFSITCALRSPDRSFQDKEFSTHQVWNRARSHFSLKSQMRVQSAPGKVYESELEISRQQQSINIEAHLATPHSKFERQSISISHEKRESTMTSSAHLELADAKKISMSSIIKTKRQGISATCTLNTPFQPLSEAKLHFSLENERSKKLLNSYIDVNNERKGEVDFSLMSSSKATELQYRMKSIHLPEISTSVKLSRNGPIYSYEASLKRESTPLLEAKLAKSKNEFSYTFQANSPNKNLIDMKITSEISGESMKHSFIANCASLPPVSITFQVSKNDEHSRSVSLVACKEQNQRQCLKITGYHKGLTNSENYHHYRKITFVAEKVTGQSSVDHLFNVHFVFATGEHDFRSKLILEAREKTLGYEVRVHKREHEQEPCHLDMHLFAPSRTVRISGSALHSSENSLFDLELTPDASITERKLSLELKREYQANKASGYLKISHPRLEKPIQVTYQIEKESQWPVSAKLELDYSKQQENKLTLEMSVESERGQPEKKTIIYKLYRQDQTLSVNVKVLKQESREEDLYGYEWIWQSTRGQKSGGFKIRFSDKRSGKPQALEITYYTPTVNLQAIATTQWSHEVPSEIHVSILSQKQQIYEMVYKKEGSCAELELLRSGSFMKHQICLNKPELDRLKVLSVQSYYRDHKCLDFKLDVDPRVSHVARIALKWEKEDFQRAAREMNEISAILNDQSLAELEEEILEKARLIVKRLRESVVRPFMRSLNLNLKSKYSQLLKEHREQLRSCKENVLEYIQETLPHLQNIRESIWEPMYEQIHCVFKKTVRFVEEHFPEALRFLWNAMREELEDCLKRYCPRGTFCYRLKRTYQRQGIKQVQLLLQQRFQEVQQQTSQKILKAANWIPNFWEIITRPFEMIKNYYQSFMMVVMESPLVENIRRQFEHYENILKERYETYFEKIMEKLRELMERANEDNDFRTLKTLLKEGKEKALKAWERRESLAQEAWKPIQEAVLEELPRNWIREKIAIEKFNMKEGEVEVQLHHPFDRSSMEMLNNTLQAMKNKVMSSSPRSTRRI